MERVSVTQTVFNDLETARCLAPTLAQWNQAAVDAAHDEWLAMLFIWLKKKYAGTVTLSVYTDNEGVITGAALNGRQLEIKPRV